MIPINDTRIKKMGIHTYIDKPRIFGNLSHIYIGDYCSVASGCVFDCGFQHNAGFVSTFPFTVKCPPPKVNYSLRGRHPKTNGDIHIGNDVWIGLESVIMSGVKIGDGAVVGARSVVTKDVEPYFIVAGSPATHKSYRFSYYQIFSLQRIMWWEWPIEKIYENLDLLMSDNIDEFCRKHDEGFYIFP